METTSEIIHHAEVIAMLRILPQKKIKIATLSEAKLGIIDDFTQFFKNSAKRHA